MTKPNNLKIVLFDGSLRPSTFVYRLAVALAQEQEVYIAGFSGHPRSNTDSITYLDLGTAERPLKLFWKSLLWSFRIFFKKFRVNSFIRTVTSFLNKDFKSLQQQNLDLSLELSKPDIVHLQWPSLLPWFENHFRTKNYRIILSQRGYQINIRPFLDSENMNYLSKWYPKMDGFHSVSEAVSNKGDVIYNSLGKIDEVVYSGFAIDEFEMSRNRKKKTTLKILSIGRPHWIKGYSDALRAMELLKKDSIRFEYTIVGDADDEELLFLINSLKLEKEITLMKKVAQEVVYEMMQDSDVFLLPSLEEGLPNVVVESMLLGTPVITTKCGGVEELVDESTGFLAEVGQPESIYNAIKAFLATSESTLQTMVDKAHKKAREQHSESQMQEGMLALYRKVLASHSQ